MTKMIPAQYDISTVSAAERRIFDLLKNDPGANGWTVIHSLGLTRRGRKPYGEIDFVVLIPGTGILCLEVKGGRVVCKDGVWTTTNREGKTFEMNRSPFMQAMEGMQAVRKAIENKFGLGHPAATVAFGRGVILPDVQMRVEPFEWERWEGIDYDDLRQPISVALLHMAREQRRKLGIPVSNREPSSATLRLIQQFLRPDFEPVVTKSAQLHQTEVSLLRLTEEQYDGLDLLADNERCLFEGAAGTGKTMLALEYARRSASAGYRTLLLCFNKLLGEWFRSQVAECDATQRLTAGRHYQLLREAIISSPFAAEFQVKEKQDSGPELYATIYPFYGQLALDGANPFDVVVIDEAQDMLKPGILDVLSVWQKGGLASGRWAIFGDFHRQAIFENSSGDEMKALLTSRVPVYSKARLRQNCRNTRNIGEETALLSGFASPPYRMGQIEGPPVDYHYYQSAEAQSAALAEILRRLLRDGVTPEDIVVLSKLRLNNSGVNGTDGGNDFRLMEVAGCIPAKSRTPVIQFATIQAFKGMESKVVVLCDAEQVAEGEPQALLYVGMSRARSLLIVLLHEQTKPSVKQAVARKLQEGWNKPV
jgi:hypothetical protein